MQIRKYLVLFPSPDTIRFWLEMALGIHFILGRINNFMLSIPPEAHYIYLGLVLYYISYVL